MSPGSSTVDENKSSKLLYSMAQRQQKNIQMFSHQSCCCPENFYDGKWRGGGMHNYKQDGRMPTKYSLYQVYHEPAKLRVEGGNTTDKWVLSAGGKWDAIEWLHDSQALFTLKQLLTRSSPHQQAQRRAISVWKPFLSCCHMLLPGPARQFPDSGHWQWSLSVSSDASGRCCSQLLGGPLCAISIYSFNRNTFPCLETLAQKETTWAGYPHHRLHGPLSWFE